jgi:hypothetical protein
MAIPPCSEPGPEGESLEKGPGAVVEAVMSTARLSTGPWYKGSTTKSNALPETLKGKKVPLLPINTATISEIYFSICSPSSLLDPKSNAILWIDRGWQRSCHAGQAAKIPPPAEKQEKLLLLFGTQCRFSRMSGVGPALPGGIPEENSAPTSKSDSLLGAVALRKLLLAFGFR